MRVGRTARDERDAGLAIRDDHGSQRMSHDVQAERLGFIEMAADSDRMEEYRRVAAFNRYCGIDVHEITPDEIERLFPLARVDDVLAGFYVEEDGRVNPVDATMALAKGARLQVPQRHVDSR